MSARRASASGPCSSCRLAKLLEAAFCWRTSRTCAGLAAGGSPLRVRPRPLLQQKAHDFITPSHAVPSLCKQASGEPARGDAQRHRAEPGVRVPALRRRRLPAVHLRADGRARAARAQWQLACPGSFRTDDCDGDVTTVAFVPRRRAVSRRPERACGMAAPTRRLFFPGVRCHGPRRGEGRHLAPRRRLALRRRVRRLGRRRAAPLPRGASQLLRTKRHYSCQCGRLEEFCCSTLSTIFLLLTQQVAYWHYGARA